MNVNTLYVYSKKYMSKSTTPLDKHPLVFLYLKVRESERGYIHWSQIPETRMKKLKPLNVGTSADILFQQAKLQSHYVVLSDDDWSDSWAEVAKAVSDPRFIIPFKVLKNTELSMCAYIFKAVCSEVGAKEKEARSSHSPDCVKARSVYATICHDIGISPVATMSVIGRDRTTFYKSILNLENRFQNADKTIKLVRAIIKNEFNI